MGGLIFFPSGGRGGQQLGSILDRMCVAKKKKSNSGSILYANKMVLVHFSRKRSHGKKYPGEEGGI